MADLITEPDFTEKKWFVLYTKPRHEFKAEEQLKDFGIEVYMPTQVNEKRWSDRVKKVTEPVFRGYTFINANEKERLLSIEAPAIIKCIFFNGKPAVIPDYEMDRLILFLQKRREGIYVEDRIETGKRVTINSGPFQGIEGIVYNHDKHGEMFGITIELLKRTVSVKLSAASISTPQF